MKMLSKKVIVQFIKFGLVGAICLSIDMMITVVLKEYVGINKYIANAIGFGISSTINFYLHKTWTFGSANKALKEYYKFLIIAGIGLVLNYLTVRLFEEVIQLNLSWIIPVESFYISKMIAVVLVFFWNFGMNRRFTFKAAAVA